MKKRMTYSPPETERTFLQGESVLAASASGSTPESFGRDAGDGGMFPDLDILPIQQW